MTRSLLAALLMLGSWTVSPVAAQSLGTFRWQMQPYCNVLTMIVSQSGSVYTLDGYDDQCGAATRAPLTGTAVPNPDGTVAFGINIVASPGAAPVHVAVPLNPATLAGTWQDDAGHSGTFVFTPGAGAAGPPRPGPSASLIPSSILLRPDGGFLAGGSENTGVIPASGAGTRMMWHPSKAAFRAGSVTGPSWDEANVGRYSVALGSNTLASGPGSTALGRLTTASGPYSIAFGNESTASGFSSMALGQATTASGAYSVAMGDGSKAIGPQSTALGGLSTASGEQSFAVGRNAKALGHQSIAMGMDAVANGTNNVAIGSRVSAGGYGSVVLGTHASATAGGSFVFGDAAGDASTTVTSNASNQFLARVTGGARFFSNLELSSGVSLAAGASAWASVSDVNMKENFRDLDSDDVLAKLARMPIREWNYKAQDAAIRHVGPTAQDFHSAFGLGEDPLRISTIDADGIALAGVKALALENQLLKAELETLRQRLDRIEITRR